MQQGPQKIFSGLQFCHVWYRISLNLLPTNSFLSFGTKEAARISLNLTSIPGVKVPLVMWPNFRLDWLELLTYCSTVRDYINQAHRSIIVRFRCCKYSQSNVFPFVFPILSWWEKRKDTQYFYLQRKNNVTCVPKIITPWIQIIDIYEVWTNKYKIQAYPET